MRATEWVVNGLAGSSDHPSGLISVKPVRIATVLGSRPGALVGTPPRSAPCPRFIGRSPAALQLVT
jgi:hypothetical protein